MEVTKAPILADILDPPLPGAFPLTVGKTIPKASHTRICKICHASRAPQLSETWRGGREVPTRQAEIFLPWDIFLPSKMQY